jgi:ATP/maltotriose-dependent transcriptional regulator MalT
MIRTAPSADERVTEATPGERAGVESATSLVAAFEAALAAGDIRRAATLVEAHVRDPREPTPPATLAGLVGRLPASLVLASPALHGALVFSAPPQRPRRDPGVEPGVEGSFAADALDDDKPLSTREREILGLLATGMSNREIAGALFLGVNTVKWYLKALYVRFGVSSRMECVHEARMRGLIP